jgi:hypothetical protein
VSGPLQALITDIRKSRVLRAGLALIVAGVVCLYLSDQVVTGWWQGTLDAFGVGFIVGGVVDVLAITGLNQALTGEQRQRENDLEASSILRAANLGLTTGVVEAARDHLIRSGRQLSPRLAEGLVKLVTDVGGGLGVRDVQLPGPERADIQREPAEAPDHGDAPRAPGTP